ncbi:MAG TPA: hypothetical protein VGU01_01530 [Sphingomicrobium sp.]|nr:hypothetical protein [Sphingomicrobium sp.]
MKDSIGRAVLSSQFQNSLLGSLARAVVRRTRGIYPYSGVFLADFNAIERPHYAYCMLGAARLAKRLGIDRISAVEFGVAGGNGLKFMCEFAQEVRRATGVTVDCIGFDSGKGMPEPQGREDLPYWFRAEQYKMEVADLKSRVPQAKLILGDIADTILSFAERERPAPIGAIMNDVDYFSSTMATLKLFEQAKASPEMFLPRLFMYFDDIIGSDTEMYGPFNGQLAAINAFNAQQEDCKIHLNQNLLPLSHLSFRYQIYYTHLLTHPDYSRYIGGDQQLGLEEALRLRER